MKSKDKAVKGLTSGIEFLFKKNGVDYAKGWGKFSGENTVAVDNNDGTKSEFKVKNVIIATGSEPSTLPAGILDIDEQFVVTSTGALDLKTIPKRMVVVGGGVIGLEMGSVYNRLGSEVTVIQHTDRICPFLDKEISAQFEKILRKQGLKFKMNTRLEGGVNNKEKGVKVILGTEKGKEEMEADVVLLSIGRRPYTGGLQLEKAGLSTNKYGRIEINKHW
jgi:dihydrolipoamide dehydrogenase